VTLSAVKVRFVGESTPVNLMDFWLHKDLPIGDFYLTGGVSIARDTYCATWKRGLMSFARRTFTFHKVRVGMGGGNI
jgi:hypothetical protein